ncbi:uncharacterized protein BJ171DRAFT_499864 [Polychytrium aggregatum]|uniref:uncharacterized protein n=1 Tax=Polychytrium aggregatum TaxID=110093 RepID=UPI0022FE6709|nr:uncharacterized protein BJ171DRAFT_499864 [Polychytrium aggregatum]KAI9205837.1 hypothetical protein BJ171DRAFT_499864 [Polychytrium aggregatum]
MCAWDVLLGCIGSSQPISPKQDPPLQADPRTRTRPALLFSSSQGIAAPNCHDQALGNQHPAQSAIRPICNLPNLQPISGESVASFQDESHFYASVHHPSKPISLVAMIAEPLAELSTPQKPATLKSAMSASRIPVPISQRSSSPTSADSGAESQPKAGKRLSLGSAGPLGLADLPASQSPTSLFPSSQTLPFGFSSVRFKSPEVVRSDHDELKEFARCSAPLGSGLIFSPVQPESSVFKLPAEPPKKTEPDLPREVQKKVDEVVSSNITFTPSRLLSALSRESPAEPPPSGPPPPPPVFKMEFKFPPSPGRTEDRDPLSSSLASGLDVDPETSFSSSIIPLEEVLHDDMNDDMLNQSDDFLASSTNDSLAKEILRARTEDISGIQKPTEFGGLVGATGAPNDLDIEVPGYAGDDIHQETTPSAFDQTAEISIQNEHESSMGEFDLNYRPSNSLHDEILGAGLDGPLSATEIAKTPILSHQVRLLNGKDSQDSDSLAASELGLGLGQDESSFAEPVSDIGSQQFRRPFSERFPCDFEPHDSSDDLLFLSARSNGANLTTISEELTLDRDPDSSLSFAVKDAPSFANHNVVDSVADLSTIYPSDLLGPSNEPSDWDVVDDREPAPKLAEGTLGFGTVRTASSPRAQALSNGVSAHTRGERQTSISPVRRAVAGARLSPMSKERQVSLLGEVGKKINQIADRNGGEAHANGVYLSMMQVLDEIRGIFGKVHHDESSKSKLMEEIERELQGISEVDRKMERLRRRNTQLKQELGAEQSHLEQVGEKISKLERNIVVSQAGLEFDEARLKDVEERYTAKLRELELAKQTGRFSLVARKVGRTITVYAQSFWHRILSILFVVFIFALAYFALDVLMGLCVPVGHAPNALCRDTVFPQLIIAFREAIRTESETII